MTVRLTADHVRVRVPATSANLGPGFDALGLALDLADDVEVRALAGAEVSVEVTGQGAGELPTGEDHLVVQAIRAALDDVGASQVGLALRCHNRIPHGRGLGSSAAAVVAGVLAVRALISEPAALDSSAVYRIASRFEGHPDNAAPAIMGGATIAWTGADGPHATSLPLHPEVDAVVLVPAVRVPTRTARGLLPPVVPHVDAARNAARSALLVQALCHRPELLFPATEDLLHQGYRAPAMPASLELIKVLRERGQAAVVSGAGPSVLVLETRAQAGEQDGVRAELLGPTTDGVTATGWRVLRPGIDRVGATTERV